MKTNFNKFPFISICSLGIDKLTKVRSVEPGKDTVNTPKNQAILFAISRILTPTPALLNLVLFNGNSVVTDFMIKQILFIIENPITGFTLNSIPSPTYNEASIHKRVVGCYFILSAIFSYVGQSVHCFWRVKQHTKGGSRHSPLLKSLNLSKVSSTV